MLSCTWNLPVFRLCRAVRNQNKNATLKETQKYMKEIPLEDIERYWGKTKDTKGEN